MGSPAYYGYSPVYYSYLPASHYYQYDPYFGYYGSSYYQDYTYVNYPFYYRGAAPTNKNDKKPEKKESWANEKFDTTDIRKKNKAYDSRWLVAQLKISRALELEDNMKKGGKKSRDEDSSDEEMRKKKNAKKTKSSEEEEAEDKKKNAKKTKKSSEEEEAEDKKKNAKKTKKIFRRRRSI